MSAMEALDLERDTSALLSERFLRIASLANSEEDLRVAVEGELKTALQALGIESQPQYEVTFLKGRADAVYGHAIIEYEKPGKLKTKPGFDETTTQLRNMLASRAQAIHPEKPAQALGKMIGISLDGESILFCQYRKATVASDDLPGVQLALLPNPKLIEGFEIRGPYPVTPESVALMLGCLRAMSRAPLTATALTQQFGPDGDIAQELVPRLYRAVTDAPSEKTALFFDEWKRVFGIVYGERLAETEGKAPELAKLYGLAGPTPDLLPLLFAIHTYFAVLMKLIAIELLALQQGALVEPFVRRIAALDGEAFKSSFRNLESGELFRAYGISNFVEGDFFQWYTHTFRDEVSTGLRRLVQRLDDFEPPAATMQPERAEDLLKELYQALIPRSLRHALGEYYTPDWLAEYVISRTGYDGQPEGRVLDPSCGSGTFLVQFITLMRRRALEQGTPLADTAANVLRSVVGFEINPLAVIAARTNYILAMGELVRHSQPVDIPVYFADSVLTPAKLEEVVEPLFEGEEQLSEIYRYRSVVGDFPVGTEVVDRSLTPALANLIEHCLAINYTPTEFASHAMAELKLTRPQTEASLAALFTKVSELESAGLNGIWARIIKNAVAPLDVGRFDYVIGNPPWIQWEDLSPEYRAATDDLWTEQGLVAGAREGQRFALGTTKRDFSMLFSYACSTGYLKPGGTLGFLITQTVFQTGTGEVFRRFGNGDTAFHVVSADDFVDVKPFDAQNWSAAFVWREGKTTEYPVPYRLWRRRHGLQVRRQYSLARTEDHTEHVELEAEPLEPARRSSPWLLAKRGAHKHLRKIQGESSYTASSGIVTWLDGVYWLRVLEERGDGLVVVENLHDAGKKRIERVRRAIEPDLLHPFVPWASVERWRAEPTHSLLIPHRADTGYLAIPEDEMRKQYPQTLAYLYQFKEQLEARSGYRQLRQGHPFYILGNTGTDFRAPYKVVWRSMGTEIRAALLVEREWSGGHRNPEVHKNTVNFVPFHDESEALYVCGMLNASHVTTYALASSVRGGKSFGGVNLLSTIRIPPYAESEAQREVVELARAAVANRRNEDRPALDRAAAHVWGISERALAEIAETHDALMGAAVGI